MRWHPDMARDGKISFPPLRGVNKPSPRKAAPSRAQLVRCPLCSRLLPLDLIDLHLENSTCNRYSAHVSNDGADADSSSSSGNINEASHFCMRATSTALDAFEASTGRTRALFCVWCTNSRCCTEDAADSRGDFSAVVTLRDIPAEGHLKLVLHAYSQLGAPHHSQRALFHDAPLGCPSKFLAPSVLKSALQKCVRRSRTGPAVRVAVAFMRKTSLLELLRRMTVIAIEDAALTFHYPVLIWLMASITRGYQPTLNDVLYVLEAVELIAAMSIKDSGALDDPPDSFSWDDLKLLHDNHADLGVLVKSLLMRKAYGGMKGDVNMILDVASNWTVRFLQDPELWRSRIRCATAYAKRSVSCQSVVSGALLPDAKLRKGDVPLASIDSHCSGICDDLAKEVKMREDSQLLAQSGAASTQTTIAQLMWRYRSSFTDKKPCWEERFVVAQSPLETGPGDTDTIGAELELWKNKLEPLALQWSRAFLRRAGL